MDALDKAVAIYGSRPKLGARLGVSGEAIRKWALSRVPAERCRAIEDATDGQVTVYDLRPDIFGPPPYQPKPAGPGQEVA